MLVIALKVLSALELRIITIFGSFGRAGPSVAKAMEDTAGNPNNRKSILEGVST